MIVAVPCQALEESSRLFVKAADGYRGQPDDLLDEVPADRLRRLLEGGEELVDVFLVFVLRVSSGNLR